MKYTKIIGLAVGCHVAGWVIIAFQFALTAITLMPIIAIPFLNWIPPLAVLAKGLKNNSRTLIVTFPVFIGIWLVPSTLYRLAILPSYYSANASSEVRLFDTGLPDRLFIRTNNPVREEIRLLLHGRALSEIVFARPWNNSKDILYAAEDQTVDFRHLLFNAYRREELSSCRDGWLNTKILLQDFGAPACVEASEPDQLLPQHIIFSQIQDEAVKTTHTIFGKIIPTGTRDLYDFEELGRHTQKFKEFRIPALLPIFWIPSDRPSSNNPFFFMVRWQAGSEDDVTQELVLEAYQSRIEVPKYPVENHENFQRRFEYGLTAEKLDELFAGSTPTTLLDRLAEIDNALPVYDRHPSISRMYALKDFAPIAEFLCVMGFANETTGFILGSRRSRRPLLDECSANLSSDNLGAAFALGEEAVHQNELREEARSSAAQTATARYSELHNQRTKIALGNMTLTYRVREERRNYVLEVRLHERGRTLGKPSTLGIASGEQPETLFMGTNPSRARKNYVLVSNAHRFGNSASMHLSEMDVTLLAQALKADEPVLVLNHGEQSLRLSISEHNAEVLENIIARYRSLLTLKELEEEYIVPGTSW